MKYAESQTDARLTDKETLGTVAEYVCGLLDPIEHAQVHVLLGRDDQALSHALMWEAELLTLVDALPAAHPSPELRERLQRSLGIGPPPAPSSRQLLRRRSEDRGMDADAADMDLPTATTGQPNNSARAAADIRQGPPAAAEAKTLPQQAHPTLAENTNVKVARSVAHGEVTASKEAGKLPSTPPSGKLTRTSKATTPSRQSSRPSRPDVNAATTPSEATREMSGALSSSTAPQPNTGTQQAPANEAASHPSTTTRTPRERKLARKLWFWRLIGLSATAAAIVGFMLPGEPPPPPVQVVKVAPTRAAILQAPGSSSTPGWTATLDAQGNLIMQPLVQTEVPDGSQALLWTRSARIPEPRLLGKIDPNKPLQVPAERLGALADDQLLEITLETDEDAGNHAPNGPILFIGQMAVFGAEGSVTAREGASTAAGSGANASTGAGQNGRGPYNAGSATSGPITQ